MVTGRPDFWYGQVLLFEESPTDGETGAGPTSNWAYDHAADPNAHHESIVGGDVDAKIETHRTTHTHTLDQPSDHATPIATHAAVDDAHHDVYEQANADADIATHEALADPHEVYQKESEKDQNSGYAALSSDGDLLAPGPDLKLTRNVSDSMFIVDRTSGQWAFQIKRMGDDDFDIYARIGGAGKQILTTVHEDAADPHTGYQLESEKDAVSGYAALNAEGDVLGKGADLRLVRDGSDNINIYDRTSGQWALMMKRMGDGDFDLYINETAGSKKILTVTHNDEADPHTQYQKESEKDQNSGYIGAGAAGDALVPGNAVRITRDGSDNIYIQERTSGESAIYFHRTGEQDYVTRLRIGNAWKEVLTEVHTADDDAHHEVFEAADCTAYIGAHSAIAAAHHTRYTDAEAVDAVKPLAVHRGDPAAADFDEGDLTLDNTWNDLDLSGIVPAGAVIIWLHIGAVPDDDDVVFSFRKNGNSNSINRSDFMGIHTGMILYDLIPVFCDSGRVVEYRGTAANWSSIDITVAGWDF